MGITVNKNSIPNEPRSPFVTSGIRVGSAAATTRGFTAEDFYEVGQLIAATVFNAESDAKLAEWHPPPPTPFIRSGLLALKANRGRTPIPKRSARSVLPCG